jgi:two-component system response regulator DctR
MSSYRVLIAEDDAAVARLHRRIVTQLPRFTVVGITGSGEATLSGVRATKPDLLLLDLRLRGMDGVSVFRALRQNGSAPEVIAVTALSGARVVRELAHLGASDYLVKPFAPERLQRAFNAFIARRSVLSGSERLSQADIDRAWASATSAALRWLPRGLSEVTLDAVRSTLRQAPEALPASQIAETMGIARVTARRYLEFLEVNRQVTSEAVANGPGRPQKFYALRRDLLEATSGKPTGSPTHCALRRRRA